MIRLIILIVLNSYAFRLTGQSHVIFDNLLSKYVSKDGRVDYRGFIREKDRFQEYLDHLSNQSPDEMVGDDSKMAFWINAYNAFTIKLIIDNYPVESITDLHPLFYIPRINTVWHEKFFKIDGSDFSLDKIEHEILRKQFDDYRIHFAINCASKSCPDLRNEAYDYMILEKQLSDQTIKFLNDPSKNKISINELELSRIFSWFDDDFGGKDGIRSIIKKYIGIEVSYDAKTSYLTYDWALND